MEMKKYLLIIMMLVVAVTTQAQSADKLYEQGKALYEAKDYSAALPKLKLAAEKGHKKAQYRLGRCYDKGHGTAEDNVTAYQWYSKAAAQGHAKSQMQVAKCYMKGKGVAADEQKAKAWLAKAVKNQKGGDEVKAKLKEEAADGDKDAVRLLKLLGNK